MLKKHMAACLVATAFVAAPALAQTSPAPSPSPPASQPQASASVAGAQSGQFMTQLQQNQWRASKLIGVDIYGQNNEKIGDVNEVLIDRSGNADAVVVGVGGFLGIGEKDVALPFSAIQWKMDRSDLQAARPAATGTTTTAGTGAAPGTAADRPATTGATGAPGTARPAGDRADMDRGYPDHGVLSMTKEQLQNAPAFRYSMAEPAARGTGAGGTAPRQ
jgi:sporulation protein YlmC with PRC-barrel domain